MRLAFRLLPCLSMAGLAAAGLAQTGATFNTFDPFPWPTGLTGAITRSTVADFTGEGVPDVFFLIGSQPTLVYNPDACGWIHQYTRSQPVRDIDRKPREGTETADLLAFVDPDGLKLLDLHGLSSPATATTLDSQIWAGARYLRVGNVDASGTMDYVGVGSDPKVLLIRTGGTTTAVTCPYNLGEIVLLQFDADPPLEIGLLTYGGLELRDHTGTLVWSEPLVGIRGDAIAAVRPNGADQDSLAWVRKVAGNAHQELLVFEDSGIPLMPSVRTTDLGATWSGTHAFGMASANVHCGEEDASDDDLDVVLFDKSEWAPQLFQNTSPPTAGNPYFSTSAYERLELPPMSYPLPDANLSRPAFADLTADGRPDLLVPVQDTTLWLLHGDEPSSGPPSTPSLGGEVYRGMHKITQGASGTQAFSIALDVRDLRANDTTGGYTDVHFVCWVRNPTTGTMTNVFNYYFDLPATPPTGTNLKLSPEFGLTAPPTGFVPCGLADVYFFEVRAVVMSALGGITHAGPSWVTFLTFDPAAFCTYSNGNWIFYEVELSGADSTGYACSVDMECLSELPELPKPVRFPALKRKRFLPPNGTNGDPLPDPGQPVPLTTVGQEYY